MTTLGLTSPALVQSPIELSSGSAVPSPATGQLAHFARQDLTSSPSPSPPASAQKPKINGTNALTNGDTPAAAGLVEGSVRALLVPTDRPQEELEERWLPQLGRLRVEKELTLRGYSLYGVRQWYVPLSSAARKSLMWNLQVSLEEPLVVLDRMSDRETF